MRKSALVLILLLVPTLAVAQGTIQVSSSFGSIDWKGFSAAKFVPLQQSNQLTVSIGDQIRTGPNSGMVLILPDGSYMTVAENSTLTIQEFWAPSIHNLVNLMVGKVRFFIQRLGGQPNPYRVQTPTALIAVRGTTFEVTVLDGNATVVECLEGRVAVETVGLQDREVILEEGRHTLVRAGVPPVPPIAANEPLNMNRVIAVVRRDADEPVLNGKNSPSLERLLRDNDRRNRPSDPLQSPGSRTTIETQRAKPTTLRYPN